MKHTSLDPSQHGSRYYNRKRCDCGHRAYRHGFALGCEVLVTIERPNNWLHRHLRDLFPVVRGKYACLKDPFEVNGNAPPRRW